MPPFAPVAAMRAVASELVVQVTEVPGLLTRGRAKHAVPPAQDSDENLPLTHCAKSDPTQALSPAVQGELAERVANWAFSFWASNPFWRWKLPEEEVDDDEAATALTGGLLLTEDFPFMPDFPFAADFPLAVETFIEPEAGLEEAFCEPEPEPEAGLEEAFCEPEPEEGTPGFWVIATNCWPAGIGPPGLAGQEPSGLRGAECPKGMVPDAPRAAPPTKTLRLAPWNWHWKRPLSSAFFGGVWQYGTL